MKNGKENLTIFRSRVIFVNLHRRHFSPYHSWIVKERERLQITEALGSDNGKPFTYHLKRRPHKFLFAMYVMSLEKEMDGCKSFAIYPLRRTLVPRHVRFDQKALRNNQTITCRKYCC